MRKSSTNIDKLVGKIKSGNMELVQSKDVYDADKRNSRKRFLTTDAICVHCGTIINSCYEDACFICDDPAEVCDHREFITGHQSVDLRILLNFRIEDLKALAELHGCSEGNGRAKTVAGLMKKLHTNLDKRIDDRLIRKIILRNRKKFWFWRDLDDAVIRAKKPKGIPLVDQKDCAEVKEIRIKNKKGDNFKITVMPIGNYNKGDIKNENKNDKK
jgi:hypothetical protein